MPSKQLNARLTRHFDHQAAEPAWINKWGDKPFEYPRQCFSLPLSDPHPWFLPMPPPNITGQLHLGHALFLTIQDIATRHRIQRGENAWWIPGTDHAGLATHEKIIEHMAGLGQDPADNALYDAHAQQWKDKFQNRIIHQMKSMGISCDWTSLRFTLDEQYQSSMDQAFRQLAQKAHLYRKDGQWYLDMRRPAKALMEAIDLGQISITPETAIGRLRNFLEHIEPWCISRQIRWGWRLPLLYDERGNWMIDESPQAPPPPGWTREQSTADTWLLSSLWPLALLGWPAESEQLQQFYPAAWMETGEDILFFWCARMLMTGWLLTGKWAFEKIWLQGIIRDSRGRKMSKSLGNGIDPLELTSKHGTDALRWMLATHAEPGLDMRFNPATLSAESKFLNKIWQAGRFLDMCPPRSGLSPWGTSEWEKKLDDLTQAWDKLLLECRFSQAARLIQNHFRDEFCSIWIEQNKQHCREGGPELDLGRRLFHRYMCLFHPFMPYLTSELSSKLELA